MATTFECPKCHKAIHVTAERPHQPIQCSCGIQLANWLDNPNILNPDLRTSNRDCLDDKANDQDRMDKEWLATRWLLHGKDINSEVMLKLAIYSIVLCILPPVGFGFGISVLVITWRFLSIKDPIWITDAVQNRTKAAHCLAWLGLMANCVGVAAWVAWFASKS
jgi:endogenous inhibitor of DNA gyrase (YacG/DUF329 family)